MEWINRLDQMLSGLQTPTAAELNRVLRELNCAQADLAHYVTMPEAGRSYGRNVLYRSPRVEAIVVHIPPGARTSIHDHGKSVGCALVVEGHLHNVMYRALGYGMACEAGGTVVEAGNCMVTPYGQVHQMRSFGSCRTVSLHLYAPPLSGMRQYVPAEQAVLDYVI